MESTTRQVCEPSANEPNLKIRDFDTLIKVSHDTAIDRGWWVEQRSQAGILILVVTELAEAVQDYRDGKIETYYEETECGKKPCGAIVELADALVRLADWAGYYGLKFSRSMLWDDERIARITETFETAIFTLMKEATSVSFRDNLGDFAEVVFALTEKLVGSRDAMWRALEEKCAYNAKRPWRHNNKKI